MTRVTIFCTITSVGVVEAFTKQQVSGHKFILTAKDDTQSRSITVFDHTRDYHHSLYAGQSIMLENVHTSGKQIEQTGFPCLTLRKGASHPANGFTYMVYFTIIILSKFSCADWFLAIVYKSTDKEEGHQM